MCKACKPDGDGAWVSYFVSLFLIIVICTGACAAAVAAVLNGFCKKDEEISVILKGGTLKIRYTDEAVYLTGDAVTVFSGHIVM